MKSMLRSTLTFWSAASQACEALMLTCARIATWNKLSLKNIFWVAAVALGFLYAWAARHDAVIGDGISYLDMADAYLRGDWAMALNAYWSPFYSWLLGLALIILNPSPYRESTVVCFVNFAIYLVALGCFHFFLLELIRYHREQPAGVAVNGGVTIPEWVWLTLGYTLFTWSSLNLITISMASPDMCVAAFVYLASALLLRIGMGSASWFTFAGLGAVLGIGYLAKAPMLPLAMVFLGVGLFSLGNLRKAAPRTLLSLAVVLLLALPFIIVLSAHKGRLTFGDSGKLNYAWYVNGVTRFAHWQGEPAGSGVPEHPTRKIFDAPAIYEFGTPVGGTYPVWYDPSYWYEGLEPAVDLRGLIRNLDKSATTYSLIFFDMQTGVIVAVLVLYLMSGRGRLCARDIASQWRLLVPAIAALGMYSLVDVQTRYVAPFVVLLWMGVFSGVRLPASPQSRRLAESIGVALLLVMLIPMVASLVHGPQRGPMDHEHWYVAQELNGIGVQPGEKVALIRSPSLAGIHWARMARVRLVAEIPNREADRFWSADNRVRSAAIDAIAQAGATVIVVKGPPSWASKIGWQKIRNTNFYRYVLPKRAALLAVLEDAV